MTDNNLDPDPEYKTACGGMLIGRTNYPERHYQGKAVYFCRQACLQAFERDPDAFMTGEVEHPIETD